MGQAKTLDVRLNVVSMKQSGHSNAKISEGLQIGLGTVKNIWKRYQLFGEPGLSACYKNCGRLAKEDDSRAFRLIRLLKHLHPTWGVPFILLKIVEKYPRLKLHSIRHYQYRLCAGTGKVPGSRLPPPPIPEKSRIAHDAWQIDAKELLCLQNGDAACYLTVVDEATGALLAARVFPPQPYQQSAREGNTGLPAPSV